jgi:hypothetical protein
MGNLDNLKGAAKAKPCMEKFAQNLASVCGLYKAATVRPKAF